MFRFCLSELLVMFLHLFQNYLCLKRISFLPFKEGTKIFLASKCNVGIRTKWLSAPTIGKVRPMRVHISLMIAGHEKDLTLLKEE